MAKSPLLLASAAAAFFFNAGVSVRAEEVDDHSLKASRISPPPPPISLVAIPAPTPPTKKTDPKDALGDAVPTPELVGAAQKCMDVVSPKFEVRPQILSDDHWAYTYPKRATNGSVSYEVVNYSKGDITISLQDFDRFVQCRVAARIASLGQLADVRSALIQTMHATPVKETPGMEKYVARIASISAQSDLANVLVVGDYSLELSSKEISTKEMGISDPPAVALILLSSVPLPVEYQSSARLSATH